MQLTSIKQVSRQYVDDLGHLNHVFALKMLEYARDDWYAAAGLWGGRAWSADETLATIVLNVNFNYRQECFSGETLKIVTSTVERRNKSFVLAQEVIKADGKIAIDGRVTSLIMDMDAHATLPLPGSLARYFPI